MCYDIKASLEAQLSRARRRNDSQAIDEIIEKLAPLTDLPIHHATGFQHPDLLVYTDRSPHFPEVATWGLVPHWVKDEEQMKKLWNRTLNARGETIFDKPTFRSAARHSRCIIYVDGFYEHHHYKGKTYPFFIFAKDQRPLALAGLYSEWKNPETNGHFLTFSIVTSTGNLMMKRIHNNPKLSEPRMPFILSSEYEDKWLKEAEDDVDLQAIQEMIQEFPEEELKAHTVGKLRGKEYVGNSKTISDEVHYPDLVLE